MRRFCNLVLGLFGWKAVGSLPGPKCVLIGAPHTSNWDFPLALLCLGALGIEGHWIAKHTIFRPPLGWLMRRLGGIPLNRETTKDLVPRVVEAFNARESLVILLAPEGTRSRTEGWRTGFYYIAHGAGVPIALGFVDYPNKRCGIGPSVEPTGDLEGDMGRMREFYADKSGKRREREGPIVTRPTG